jgi:hypothetical protein
MQSRQRSPTPLGALIGKIVEPVAQRKGMGVTSLLTQWPEIVGARLAKICRPMELKWPAGGPRRLQSAGPAPATLVLRVDGAFALEAQHAAQLMVDRINGSLGWACVGRIAFRQGPLDEPQRPPPRLAPDARANAAAAKRAADIADAELREAMTRLGAEVIARAGSRS